MATITGTDLADNLPRGTDPDTSGADTINGLGGNDTITGGGGNDLLLGGNGDDRFLISGGSFGVDTINGGDGADRIRLEGNVVVSQLLLDAAHVSNVEFLDFFLYTISGTNSADVFNLSGLGDSLSYRTIDMGEGADSFVGMSVSDYVLGGAGNDTLDGGAGADEFTGGSGDDRLLGGSGDDRFFVSGVDIGIDSFIGGEGADRIRLSGDLTVSRLQLGAAYVSSVEYLDFFLYSISGTSGNDVFVLNGVADSISYRTIDMGEGADIFIGMAVSDYVVGGAGNDTLDGGIGNDEITGGSGNDRLVGGSGDDRFFVGGVDIGIDSFIGGDGTDRIRLTSDLTVSRLLLYPGQVNSIEFLDFFLYSISGTSNDDIFNLSGVADSISYRSIDMGEGNDIFVGMAASDFVNGGAGNDTLDGGLGNDEITGGSGNDRLTGGGGDDRFFIWGGDFGTDSYNGGLGADRIRLSGDVTVSQLLLNNTYVSGVEFLDFSLYSISGTNGADVFDLSAITGSYSYRTIDLGDGNDRFIGMRADDYVNGGAGNDWLRGGIGNDVIDGGAGIDTVDFSDAMWAMNVNLSLTGAQLIGGGLGTDRLTQIENVVGSRFNDRLAGDSGHNRIDGGAGNDILLGGAGSDALIGGLGIDTADYSGGAGPVTVRLQVTGAQVIGGGQGSDVLVGIENLVGSAFNDRLEGNAATNVLSGASGNDLLFGLDGHDVLNGNLGHDTLVGGNGNDTLRGQYGNDVLLGGGGADRFEFDVNSGRDQINLWENGTDLMQIRIGIWQGVRIDDFSDLTITQSGANAVVSFGNASVTLTGVNVAMLDASDFVFV